MQMKCACLSVLFCCGLLATRLMGASSPTVLITSPTPGQRITNAASTYLFQGTASGAAAVRVVRYQLTNDLNWTDATGTNVWSANVTLAPGTNVFQAYAEDVAGHRSSTNSVTCFLVVTDLLSVITLGEGYLTPNYSNALLEIGRGYTMTATPTKGCQFARWYVDWGFGGPLDEVATPTLNFIMQPGLALTAVFLDMIPPTLTVTNLVDTEGFTNASFQVRGTAADNVGVASVNWRLKSKLAPYQSASYNATDNSWAAGVTLAPGPNTFQVYAEDTSINRTVTNSITCYYLIKSTLTLLTNGLGSITRVGFTDTLLQEGFDYMVMAVPGPGQVFLDWKSTHGLKTTNDPTNPLTFKMESNLTLVANFVTNPFVGAKGTYHGLFTPGNGQPQAADNSGYVTLTLADSGAYTASLLLGGATVSFSTNFAPVLGATGVEGKSEITNQNSLRLRLTLAPTGKVIDGTLDSSGWLATLHAELAAATPTLAGSYTMLTDGFTDATVGPVGYGAGTVNVSANGTVEVTNTLADGTLFTQETAVGADGQWPLYASFNGGQGLFMGWMGLNTNAPALWIKPPTPGVANSYYTNGFALAPTTVVARYAAPTNQQPVLGWTNAVVELGGGNLPGPLTSQVVLTNNQARVLPGGGASNLSLTITTNNGLFTGTFVHPVTRRTNSFHGALVQNSAGIHPLWSGGWFLGTDQTGFVRIVPPNPVLAHPNRQGSHVMLSWPTVSGGAYQVEYKSSLSDAVWTPYGSSLTGTGTNLVISIDLQQTGVSQQFFRVVLAP